MDTLTGVLTALSSVENPEERIRTIKTAIADSLRLSDATARITFTDYYDHAAVPDMVINWRRTDQQRFLYLRGAPDVRLIVDELPYLADEQALIVTLGKLEDQSGEQTAKAEEDARNSGAWITDPLALDALNADRATRPPATTLLSHALVEGGRGVTSASRMASLIAENAAGFAAASEGEQAVTGRAIEQLSANLSPQQAARMSRVLRAVWEGHGASSSQFPISDSHGALTDDDLHYLLTTVDAEDVAFWDHLGRNLKTEQLARLHVPDYNANLQRLITANLRNLRIKGLRVFREPAYLNEPEENPRWIANGGLSLRGDGWRAYIATKRTEELPASDETGSPVPLSTLGERAQASGSLVTQVDLGDSSRALIYESREGTDVLHDDALNQRATGVFSDAIKTALVSPPGGGSARIDFEDMSVIGQTNSTFPANTFVASALLLLLDLNHEQRTTIREFLPDTAHPTLFEDL